MSKLLDTTKKQDFSDVKTAWAYKTLTNLYGEDLAAMQLHLEHESHEIGEAKFYKALERQVDRAEFDRSTTAQPLLGLLAPKVAANLDEWIAHQTKHVRRKSVAHKFLIRLDSMKIAIISLKLLLTKITQRKDTVTGIAVSIGQAIEDECRFGRIRDEEAKHFQKHIQKALNQRNGHTYKRAYMEAVEARMLEAGELNDSWESWRGDDNDVLFHIGARCIESVMASTGFVELDREGAGTKDDVQLLRIAPEWAEQINSRALSLAGVNTFHQPMVVPPRPWTNPMGGGYWGKGRKPVRFIRTYNRKSLERYRDVDMPNVYKAVNLIQSSAWKINKRVLETAEALLGWTKVNVKKWPSALPTDLPDRPVGIDEDPEILKAWKRSAAMVYRGERSRVSRRMSLMVSVETARKFADFEAIYFPHNLDWRGRVYPLCSFSPQGNDVTKGMLLASHAEPVGADGIKWLMIHGANTAGVDKVPFDERQQWVLDNEAMILRVAEDPLEHTDWMDADSPFCFLAFCFEWAGVKREGEAYCSALPIAFDGSCSGIQHFSAMLADEEGGRAVNLLPSEKVQDIYRIVSDKVNIRLQADLTDGSNDSTVTKVDKKTGEITERRMLGTKTLANQWVTNGVTRGETKRSVMTLAYGSKKFGFSEQILEDTVRPAIAEGSEVFIDPPQAAQYLAGLIWDTVGQVVVAAVEAMEWLQKSAKLLAAEVIEKAPKGSETPDEILKPSMPVHWVTHDGFPVWQEYMVNPKRRIDLILLGDVRLQMTVMNRESPQSKIDAAAQESGIAPNFVHSLDGSHLRFTVTHSHDKYGIGFFAMIHDSFGTIPAHAGNLFKGVRETIVDIYENVDILKDLSEQFLDQLHESQLEKMPELPQKGTLEIREILKSQFAFA